MAMFKVWPEGRAAFCPDEIEADTVEQAVRASAEKGCDHACQEYDSQPSDHVYFTERDGGGYQRWHVGIWCTPNYRPEMVESEEG